MDIDYKKLDKQRYLKGFSICQLAESSTVSKATLSRAFKGERNLRPQTIYKIATALELSVEDFLIESE